MSLTCSVKHLARSIFSEFTFHALFETHVRISPLHPSWKGIIFHLDIFWFIKIIQMCKETKKIFNQIFLMLIYFKKIVDTLFPFKIYIPAGFFYTLNNMSTQFQTLILRKINLLEHSGKLTTNYPAYIFFYLCSFLEVIFLLC